MQLAGLVTTPGRCFGGDQVLWKLPEVVVQVTVQDTRPRGCFGGNQVLWKLSGVGVQVT